MPRGLSCNRGLRYHGTTMIRKTRLGIALAAMCFGALVALGVPLAIAGSLGEPVFFDSAVYPPTPFKVKQAEEQGVELKPTPALPIWGHLRKPKGVGPFPAIVLLHGCGGLGRWNEEWTAWLIDWGYVVLNVDSFGPRGEGDCHWPPIPPGPLARALDAHGGKTYLTTLPFVDPARIAVMGGSHGGRVVLQAVNHPVTTKLGRAPFRAAVSLYPVCDPLVQPDAPLLILIGAADEVTPAWYCEQFMMKLGDDHDVILKMYPGVHHSFDLRGIDYRFQRQLRRYDADAFEDAFERIRAFLAKHLQ